jgi:hypothetical protein
MTSFVRDFRTSSLLADMEKAGIKTGMTRMQSVVDSSRLQKEATTQPIL